LEDFLEGLGHVALEGHKKIRQLMVNLPALGVLAAKSPHHEGEGFSIFPDPLPFSAANHLTCFLAQGAAALLHTPDKKRLYSYSIPVQTLIQ
jgi:hypothetical protein